MASNLLHLYSLETASPAPLRNIQPLSKSPSGCTTTKIKRSSTCTTISSVCCSCNDLPRFNQSSAVAKYRDRRRPVTVEGLVQVIADNSDAELSNPNRVVFTHDMATIETHSKTSVEPVPNTARLTCPIPCVSMRKMR